MQNIEPMNFWRNHCKEAKISALFRMFFKISIAINPGVIETASFKLLDSLELQHFHSVQV